MTLQQLPHIMTQLYKHALDVIRSNEAAVNFFIRKRTSKTLYAVQNETPRSSGGGEMVDV